MSTPPPPYPDQPAGEPYQQPGQPQYQQPGYPQPGQPQYQQPGYPQPGYPQPGQPQYPQSYPPSPYPGAGGTRVAVVWTGALLALAGLAAAIGSFLTWIHAVATGGATRDFSGISGDRDGKVTVVFAIALLILGLLILFKQGRLWVGIVATVVAAVLAFIALADIGDVSNKSKQLGAFGHLDVGVGLILVLLGALVALAAGIVAMCVRRPVS